MRKNEKGQQITITNPEEMAKRMKIINENIQITIAKRSTPTPQGKDIVEKARKGIDEK